MKDFHRLFTKAAFFFIIGVMLASLFAWTFVQGFFEHSAGNGLEALILYFVAFLAGVAAIYNYIQARSNFQFAKMS